MLKSVIVGCGKIAGAQSQALTTHGGAYQDNKYINLVACVDHDRQKREAFANSYQCQAEPEIEHTLAKHHPDVVSVCTPDSSHFLIAEEILSSENRPKLIFLEKPACHSATELKQLINLSERTGVEIVVNHTRRFDQHHQQLRDRITAGEFGTLITANIIYYSGWQHNGVHIVDTLCYLMNDSFDIIKITASTKSLYENDPTLEMEAVFKDCKSKITIKSFAEEYYQLFEIDLRFTQARLRLEDFGNRILLETKYINEIDENVIKLVDNGLTNKRIPPMQLAIRMITQSIKRYDRSILDGYRIQDISQTMQTIWQGQKMAQKA
jgi:predicted dehydrogenase